MSGPIGQGDFPKALQVGVNKWWGTGYGKHPLQLSDIYSDESSSKAYEEDVQIVGTGLMPVKAKGAGIKFDTLRQGYTQRYTHLTYAMGVIFTYEMLQDGQYALGFKQARYLGFSARQTQETVAANVLNRAFNSAYTFADGSSLCATDHARISGGVFKNKLSVDADLSEIAVEQALIDIGNLEDDRGNKIAVKAKKLIVPNQLMFQAARILKSEQQSGTANNDINTIRTETGLGHAVNNFLTDPDAWFITTNVPDGMKRIKRESVSAPKREEDFDTSNMKFKCMFRESYGCTDPRGIYGSAGG